MDTATTEEKAQLDLDLEEQHNTEERQALVAAWDACEGPVLLVLTPEDGVNTSNAQIRHLAGETWLYVDDENGFLLLSQKEIECWIVVART